jgi:LPXTG-motif cell wall-anchored protein
VAPELQVIGIGTTSTIAPETDFLVLFPNELPRTGRSVNWILVIGAALLLIIGSVVGFANGRFNNGSKKKRGAMQ